MLKPESLCTQQDLEKQDELKENKEKWMKTVNKEVDE
jgi:hypothetical protein